MSFTDLAGGCGPMNAPVAYVRSDTITKRSAISALLARAPNLTVEEVVASCEPLDVAGAIAFSDSPVDNDDTISFFCCGQRCNHRAGLMTGGARCERCGAEIVDVCAPLDSPILPRGNAYVTVPGDELDELVSMARGRWIVTNLGTRGAR